MLLWEQKGNKNTSEQTALLPSISRGAGINAMRQSECMCAYPHALVTVKEPGFFNNTCNRHHKIPLELLKQTKSSKDTTFSEHDPPSYDRYLSSSKKGRNRIQTLTSAMLVQCTESWALKPTGSWPLWGSMISPYKMHIYLYKLYDVNTCYSCIWNSFQSPVQIHELHVLISYSNISKTRKTVSSDIQTLRSGLKRHSQLLSVWTSNENTLLSVWYSFSKH